MPSLSTLYVGLEWLARGRRKTFSSRTELETWQNKKTLRFLRGTTPRSIALRNRFNNVDLADWRLIDPIGKTEMMRTFDELVTRPINKRNAWETALAAERERVVGKMGSLSVGMSSGTSGSRGLFVVAPAEKARWAGAMLGRILGNDFRGKHRIALLLRANNGLYETLGGRNISFRYVDILQPPDRWMDDLAEFNPTLIAAPPSILRKLPETQRADARKLTPRKLYGVAEVLDETDRGIIKQTWDVPLFQIYQATEGFLGVSADEDRMILNEDLLVIEREWIDQSRGLFAPVVTDFSRVTQPIVRYRLDDVLEETDAGQWAPYRAVSRVHGRVTDLLNLTTLAGKPAKMTGDLISRAIISSNIPPLNHEIIQRVPNELEIHVLWPNDPSEAKIRGHQNALEKSIQEWCARSGLASPRCAFSKLESAPSPAVKFRRIRQCADASGAEVVARLIY